MLTQFMQSFNVMLAPLVMLLLIVVDYARGYTEDLFLRKAYLFSIMLTVIAILGDMTYDTLAGMEGPVAHTLLYISCFVYYVFQIAAYHSTNIFVDYLINKNKERAKRLAAMLGILMLLHIIVLLLNIRYDFYFIITPENLYLPGPLYSIRLVFSYLAAAIAIGNVIISRRNVKVDQIGLILFFVLLTGIGSSVDLFFSGAKLVWPCCCSALLFIYFFIIRAEGRIDALTGVNNRKSCEEFIKTIAASSGQQHHGFIMIDIDDFKEINDSFGHVVGDHALQDAAQILRSCLRKNDFLGRYGGDEFLVAARMDDVSVIAKRIEQECLHFNETSGRTYKLHMSMGYAHFSADGGMAMHEFIAHIDKLMYSSKKRRKERRS